MCATDEQPVSPAPAPDHRPHCPASSIPQVRLCRNPKGSPEPLDNDRQVMRRATDGGAPSPITANRRALPLARDHGRWIPTAIPRAGISHSLGTSPSDPATARQTPRRLKAHRSVAPMAGDRTRRTRERPPPGAPIDTTTLPTKIFPCASMESANSLSIPRQQGARSNLSTDLRALRLRRHALQRS